MSVSQLSASCDVYLYLGLILIAALSVYPNFSDTVLPFCVFVFLPSPSIVCFSLSFSYSFILDLFHVLEFPFPLSRGVQGYASEGLGCAFAVVSADWWLY